jgi:hypothetical protein
MNAELAIKILDQSTRIDWTTALEFRSFLEDAYHTAR